ncbi:MAG: hypothetical protein EPO68_09510 [Planctomycetota bacterium]|nr:MAG: hypothetical protein EPO68_09510 [Planctomycetota bacterium]
MSLPSTSRALERAAPATEATVDAPVDPKPSDAKPARLLHGKPREILARIVPGDPLALRALIADRLDERHLIADADRLQLQLLIRVARHAAVAGARGELRAWLLARLDPLLDELATARDATAKVAVARDAIARDAIARDALARDSAPSGAVESFARSLGLDPPRARRAIAALNACTPEQRRAFHGLVLLRRGLDELARAEQVNASELGRRARAALDAVLHAIGEPAPAEAAP